MRGVFHSLLIYSLLNAAKCQSQSSLLSSSIMGSNGYLNMTSFWGNIPTSPVSIPRGCVCEDTSSSPCVNFDCSCICDLTAGKCDPNCCCDTECSPQELFSFKQSKACLSNGPPPSNITFCNNPGQISISNIGLVFTTPSIDPLICVSTSNNPVNGIYVSDPGLLSLSDAAQAYAFKSNSFITSTNIPQVSAKTSIYNTGDNIPFALNIGSSATETLISQGDGFFSLPSPDISGYCSDLSLMKFNKGVVNNYCIRKVNINKFSQDCLSVYSISNIITNVRIARSPSSSILDSASFSSILTNLASTVATSVASDNTTCANGLQCVNALVGANFHFKYNNNTISYVSADLSTATFSSCSQTLVTQSFNVDFSPASPLSSTSYNAVPRIKSGNPGYVKGSYILVGLVQSNGIAANVMKKAVSINNYGLTILAPSASGTCGTNSISALFGFDILSSCEMVLSLAQLQSMCKDVIPLPLNFTTNILVGSYGNADPLTLSDWIPITPPLQPSGAMWNSLSQTCSGIITSINYEFVIARVGSIHNLQNKIVNAKAVFQTSSWTFNKPTQAQVVSQTVFQTFTYSSTVTYIYLPDGAKSQFIPPSPNIIPPLPNDLLYPFKVYVGSGTSSINQNGLHLAFFIYTLSIIYFLIV